MDGQSQFRATDVEPTTAPIVIVGAGPVGLSLGLTLAHQRIESLNVSAHNGWRAMPPM
jgi:hypothetical protein